MNESNRPGDHDEPASQRPETDEPGGSEAQRSEADAHGSARGDTDAEGSAAEASPTEEHTHDAASEPGSAAASAESTAASEIDRTDADTASEADPREGGDTEATAEAETAEGGGDPPRAAGTGGRTGGPRKRRWPIALAVLVVLALLAGLGAGGYRLYQRIERLEARVEAVPEQREQALARFARSDALAESISALEGKLAKRIDALNTRIQELSAQREDATQALRQRLQQLQEAVATARELAGRDQLDWRLAEVHYLVAVAARRLAIAHDRRAAIAALEAADRSLAAVGDVRLIELRQRLIDDITTLQGIEPADVEGIALRIQSLLQRLPDLPPADQPSRDEPTQTTAADDGAGWWQQVRQRLSRYISVRRQAGDGGPARPRADKALPASEKLGYALSEARRAALQREPDTYRAALERGQAILERRYAADAPTVERFRERLADLRQRNVVTDYPDLTKTLDAVAKVSAELKARRERPDVVESDRKE